MPLGSVAAGRGGTRSLHGVPVGYQHTEDGAIAAAINYQTLSQAAVWDVRTRDAVINYICTPATRVDSRSASAHAVAVGDSAENLDTYGNVLTANGSIDPNHWLIIVGDGRYGAYLPVSATADRVTVKVWGPTVAGVGNTMDTANLGVTWYTSTDTVEWIDGDWRLADLADAPVLTGPQPAESRNPATSLLERESLLGPGWLAPSNARVTNLNASDLGRITRQ